MTSTLLYLTNSGSVRNEIGLLAGKQMIHFNALFDRMDAWRHLPDYQLERRADLFFSLYLAEALQAKLGFPIIVYIQPNGVGEGVISFSEFSEVVRGHNDPMSQRFSTSLAQWAEVKAGERRDADNTG